MRNKDGKLINLKKNNARNSENSRAKCQIVADERLLYTANMKRFDQGTSDVAVTSNFSTVSWWKKLPSSAIGPGCVSLQLYFTYARTN